MHENLWEDKMGRREFPFKGIDRDPFKGMIVTIIWIYVKECGSALSSSATSNLEPCLPRLFECRKGLPAAAGDEEYCG